jgi:hypothetical protein
VISSVLIRASSAVAQANKGKMTIVKTALTAPQDR